MKTLGTTARPIALGLLAVLGVAAHAQAQSDATGKLVDITNAYNVVTLAAGDRATAQAGGTSIDHSRFSGTAIQTSNLANVVVLAAGSGAAAWAGGIRLQNADVQGTITSVTNTSNAVVLALGDASASIGGVSISGRFSGSATSVTNVSNTVALSTGFWFFPDTHIGGIIIK